MSIVILAEKPSVARDIASSLGVTGRSKGYLHGNGYVVTWALGHLVTLPEPHQINPAWKAWRPDLLPMIPGTWPLQVVERTQEQFDIVSGILKDKAVTQVVCATDAGLEGVLIFRYISAAVGGVKPVNACGSLP
jgi:DNA topoisomerase-3